MGFTQLSWVTLIRLTRGGEAGGERRGRRVGTGFAPNLSASSPDTNRVSKHRGDHVSRKQWCNSQRVNKWSRVQRGRHFWCNSPSAGGWGGVVWAVFGVWGRGFLCLGRLCVFHLCPTLLFLGWKCVREHPPATSLKLFPAQQCFQDLFLQPVLLIVSNVSKRKSRASVVCLLWKQRHQS